MPNCCTCCTSSYCIHARAHKHTHTFSHTHVNPFFVRTGRSSVAQEGARRQVQGANNGAPPAGRGSGGRPAAQNHTRDTKEQGPHASQVRIKIKLGVGVMSAFLSFIWNMCLPHDSPRACAGEQTSAPFSSQSMLATLPHLLTWLCSASDFKVHTGASSCTSKREYLSPPLS